MAGRRQYNEGERRVLLKKQKDEADAAEQAPERKLSQRLDDIEKKVARVQLSQWISRKPLLPGFDDRRVSNGLGNKGIQPGVAPGTSSRVKDDSQTAVVRPSGFLRKCAKLFRGPNDTVANSSLTEKSRAGSTQPNGCGGE